MSAPEADTDAEQQDAEKQVSLDLQSGGWALILAGLISLGLVVWLAGPAIMRGPAEIEPDNGFDLSGLRHPREAVVRAAVRDGLPALGADGVQLSRVAAEAAEKIKVGAHSELLVAGDRVIGVALNGEAVALPLSIMQWHEVANLTVGGQPLLVTYSALCDSARAYRADDGQEFGVSGLLASSNTLLYDKRPSSAESSLWSQLTGEALAGPRAGERLAVVPCQLTQWAAWKRAHPETTLVLSEPDLEERGKLYRRDAYSMYAGEDFTRFPLACELPADSKLRHKTRVLVVTAGGETQVYPLDELASGPLTQGTAELQVELVHDPQGVQPSVGLVSGADDVLACYYFAWWALGQPAQTGSKSK